MLLNGIRVKGTTMPLNAEEIHTLEKDKCYFVNLKPVTNEKQLAITNQQDTHEYYSTLAAANISA